MSNGMPGCIGCFPAARRGHRGGRLFEHPQQGVLDSQPHVLADRPTHPQFVDLVDVDDATLSHFQVTIRCLDHPIQEALNVVTDVPGLGQEVASPMTRGMFKYEAT